MGDSTSLVPHAVCWRQDPALIWTMVATNAITALSYVVICLTLLALARRTRRVLDREWAYFVVGFALFIVACGSTHLLEVVTTWIPVFWVDASVNVITAVLSAYVAAQFLRRSGTIGFGINDYAARLANAENENAQMESSLLAAQKLDDWSQVSASVSHEIANPLEGIQNLLYLIRNTEGVPAEAIAYAEAAAGEADRTMTIARSALDFLRQSAAPECVDLKAAAESVRFLLDRMLRERRLHLEILTQPSGEENSSAFTVEALSGEPRQVLLNLIRNAAEATLKDEAKIWISLVSRPAEVEVVVADEGAGIDPALLPLLFQFGASTKGPKGNGMGLWTIKHIMSRHGGKVSVQSEPGEGTRFTLTWPRRFSGPSAGASSHAGSLPANDDLIVAAGAVGALDIPGRYRT